MASTNLLVMSFDATKAAAQLGVFAAKQQRLFIKAVRVSMEGAAVEIHRRSDQDIKRAGAFSERWPAALQVENSIGEGTATMRVGFDSSIPYAHVHEFGATIRGRPLLWIPLPWNPHKVSASAFPGKLFRVERQGKHPLLFSDDGAQYVGVTEVTLRPRFHIRSIVANVVRTTLAILFAKTIKAG